MSKEFAIYPFKKLGISQRHDQGNHVPHWKSVKNYSDKPWDECCGDKGRDYFIPQNDFKVEQILGLNTTKVTNSVRLVSVNKLYMPYKSEPDYLKITLTHMAEEDIKKLKVGQILKKGSKDLREYVDGQATGNHFHITANTGKYYGCLKNNRGKWCFTYAKSLLPTEAFYVDKNFTSIKNANGYKFKEVPKDEKKKEEPKPTNFLPKRGYFKLGDLNSNVGKIATFMYKTFPAYTKKSALGNLFGKNLQSAIKEFQRRTGLEADGCVGPKTLAKLEKHGFKY